MHHSHNPSFSDIHLTTTNPKKNAHQVSAAFTALQFACLGGMWALKSSSIGVLFPLLIAALAPIRMLIEKFGWFSKSDLEILDAEDD